MPEDGSRQLSVRQDSTHAEKGAEAVRTITTDSVKLGVRRLTLYAFSAENWQRPKAEVAALIERIGFFGIDLGSLAVGGKLAQFPGGPLPNQNLVRVG